jgi:hypothetical protein
MATNRQRKIEQSYRAMVLGPRHEGGTYLSAYWQQTYKVLRIDIHNQTPWLTVLWEDGRTTKHATAWDKHDKVI